ncbi:ABC transporter substrate-binding protein [Teichococcus aestuarii]|uniref:ABC transporter substrate-binding protein n=1 Tax=Teichococcus aestuarii TaxID=568898 RepID=UPI003611A27B
MLHRRSILALPLATAPLATATLARPALAQAGWPRSVTDMVGRGVTLPRPPRRVVAAESAVLLNLSLIHPDPVPLLVGMGGDLRRIDPGAMAALAARFLGLDAVPELTRQVGEDLPLERLIALAPDLVLMAAWQHRRPGTAEALRTLERAGIPVVFIDFFINPLSRALPSLQLLAEVLDRREAAAAYAAFYTAKLEAVRRAVAGRRGPAVLLQAFPGRWPCCWVAGDQGGGELVAALGGRNAAEGQLPGPSGGNLSVEQVLVTEPEVYIGTGMAQPPEGSAALRLGWGVAPEVARRSLAQALRAPELAHLPAVRQGRAFGLWNYLGGTALNVVALEAMAGWLYPDLAATLDPAATLAEINARFAAAPWQGTFWTAA